MKPIHKFNNGRGATLCNDCRVIISEKLTDDLYCEDCKSTLRCVGYLTVSWSVLREVFQDNFWNDHEMIICVPTDRISDEQWEELFEYGVSESARDVDYLISEL